jgi:MerR family mercuric resistance operon transcriptional regulator
MPARYTISQLARAADVPASTLRYYERVALLEPEDRSQGNYRLYTAESLRRLRFIRAAQAIGFTLGDVKLLLGTQDGSTPSCHEVQHLVEQRLEDIDRRLSDLRHVQKVLRAALQKCWKTERQGCCHVLETLRSSSSSQD